MAMGNRRILVIGYGNPGRRDDGVGPILAERLESMRLPGVVVESDYQLNVEHAALVAEHELVVFADASVDADSPYYFRRIGAVPAERYSSHSVTPGEVLLLAKSCFNAVPEAYLLGIRAHVVDEFGEGLSAEAEAGLNSALQFLLQFIAARLPNPES
jgi:hydrogenase maturation protease